MVLETQQPMKRRTKVLVFGDWVVDDYWVMGIHRSPTASRTGRVHYRSLHPLNGSVRALCGAGRTASALFNAVAVGSTERLFDVIGIGFWHPEDDSAISQLLSSRTPRGNPYRLTREEIAVEEGCRVVNLAASLLPLLKNDALKKKLPHDGDYQGVATTRMIRILQNTGTRIELVERIDWELQAPYNELEQVHAWFPKPESYTQDAHEAAKTLEDNLPRINFGDIDAVVIKDLSKGCVSSATVRWLKGRVPQNARWFVSSKSWKPSWLEELPKSSLDLLMIPQVAARNATHDNRPVRWLTKAGIPTLEAIDCLDGICRDYSIRPDKTLVAVLPNKQQALFRGKFGQYDCQTQRLKQPIDLDFEVAMASVLLPSLATYLIHRQGDAEITEGVRAAASFTDEWMRREVDRISAAEDTDPVPRLALELGKGYAHAGEWTAINWEDERRRWRAALTGLGILNRTHKEDVASIELSRSMTALEGYVCLTSHKTAVVRQLLREVQRFIGSHSRRHVSLLLTASPGLGKSALIDAIVKSESMASYTINVAQLAGRSGVIDEFDTVATLQAQSRGIPLLVFVDEINSELESQHVYDLFLSVMQNGEYVREGSRFRLDPCLWVFAGTATPTHHDSDPATKAPDFESRLTVSPMSLDLESSLSSAESEIARLERVYLGVAIVTAQFPDVRRVTRKVLRLFHMLPNTCTVRDLVKLVSTFDNVQLGKVHSGNVHESSVRQIKSLSDFDFSDWHQADEESFVKIIAR